ncbi:MAG: hypothetical protein J6T41_00400 [Neisseriaceae bacterium]|nr:hypothetical protein [Neisseriaceae bacterium]
MLFLNVYQILAEEKLFRLPEMVTDKSATTPAALMNCYAIHWTDTPLQATDRF